MRFPAYHTGYGAFIGGAPRATKHGSFPAIERPYCLAAFLIGLFSTATVNLVGAMPLGELVLMVVCLHAMIVVALTKRLPSPIPAYRLLYVFIGFQAVALFSYVISDLWRESSNVDMIRGWLRMIFVIIDMATLGLVLGVSGRAFVWLQVGTALSFMQMICVPPLFNDYWKFGFGFPVTSLVVLLAPRIAGLWGASLGLVALGVLNFFMDYRSLGAECIAIAAVLLLRLLPKTARKTILIITAIVCLGVLPLVVSKVFGMSGSGRANRSNVERSAMIQAAWEGFTNSPVIGQGSWFSKSDVMSNFLRIRAEKEEAAGGGMGFAEDDETPMAIHSQILVSVAEGGVFGGIFFFMFGAYILWAMWFAITEAPWHWTLPSRFFILVSGFVNLWMSPFSGPARIGIATTVLIIALFWRERCLGRAKLPLNRGGFPKARLALA
jgi:hypothetical protein